MRSPARWTAAAPARARVPHAAGVRTALGRDHTRPPGLHLRRAPGAALARRPPHPDLAPPGCAGAGARRAPRRRGRARGPGRAAVSAGHGVRGRVPRGPVRRAGRRAAVHAGPARARGPARGRPGRRAALGGGDHEPGPGGGAGLSRVRRAADRRRGRGARRRRPRPAIGRPGSRGTRLPPVHLRFDPRPGRRADQPRQRRRQRPPGPGRLRPRHPPDDQCGLAAALPRHGAGAQRRGPGGTRGAVGADGPGGVPARAGALAAAARRASERGERGAQLRLRLLRRDRHRRPEGGAAAGPGDRVDQRQ